MLLAPTGRPTWPLRDICELLTICRIMFGTDHPFFPPLGEDEDKWLSVTSNMSAIKTALSGDEKIEQDILGGNAVRVLRLTA